MIIKPLVRSNMCLNAHPIGCVKEVKRQIDYILSKKSQRDLSNNKPKTVIVLGCSTGYGLASRITAAFEYNALTIGVSFEREGTETKCGSPGFYNNKAFDQAAEENGIKSITFNMDAFSNAATEQVIQKLQEMGLQADLIIYSLASPVRTDPETGAFYRSVLKPIGEKFLGKTIDIISSKFNSIEVESATQEEIENTVKVMGGEDWKRWITQMQKANVLAHGCKTVAYSYIGPALSHAIYRDGTIGEAKKHLEKTASSLKDIMKSIEGDAFVSINKGVVTRSSAVIPIMPFYISILYKVMKRNGTHEGCIEQCERLFSERLYSGAPILVDENGLIRLDEFEMDQNVQKEVAETIHKIEEANLNEMTDFKGFLHDFYIIHGFDVEGVDYTADISRLDQI